MVQRSLVCMYLKDCVVSAYFQCFTYCFKRLEARIAYETADRKVSVILVRKQTLLNEYSSLKNHANHSAQIYIGKQ